MTQNKASYKSRVICDLCNSEVNKILYDFGQYSILKCEECGLVFKSKVFQLNRHELLTPYKEAPWTKDLNLVWQQTSYNKNHPKLRMWQSYLQKLPDFKLSEGKKLLDIGCSTGLFGHVARGMGWDVTGVEICRPAAEYAQEKFGLQVLTTTLEAAHLAEDSFDVITMWDVIEHLPSPAETVTECYRILKPGGLLIIHTPDQDALIYSLVHVLCRLSTKKSASFLSPIYGPGGHMFYFNKATLKQLFSKRGFDIVYIGSEPVWLEGCVSCKTLRGLTADLADIVGGLINKRFRMTIIGRK